MPNTNILKQFYLSISVSQADAFKNRCITECKWTKDQWFNKLHGRTSITALESERIVSIHKDFEVERPDLLKL